MKIIHTVSELRALLKNLTNIGFVPTMGNLHAGHVHLVALAKARAEYVVVSIFVNPLQFGPNEDFSAYPRTLKADCEKLQGLADIVFAPSADEMYPEAQTMIITPPPIAAELCGASRPGHFSGVATVVMKLFNMVQPQFAVFGKKDFQQLFIIRALVNQFNLPIEIVASEIIRESDGLAMSSRNGYLSTEERAMASQLHQALQQLTREIKNNNKHFAQLEQQSVTDLNQSGWTTDYVSVRNALTLLPAQANDKDLVVLGAAKIGKTRLIDNIEVALHD